MLVQTLYTSRARLAITDKSNGDILMTSLVRNAGDELTGFLFRSNGHFLQFLEGPEKRWRT